jgi:hypothetical protein
MRKLKMITKRLHIEADVNAKVRQYVNPADAGPNKIKDTIDPPRAPRSLVVKAVAPNATIKMTVIHNGS